MDSEKNTSEFKEIEKTPEKAGRIKKLRSQFMLKKGAYSFALIAFVLAALILLNWVVSTLGGLWHLEFDMSDGKVNSMSEENIDFVRGIESKVTITVCSSEYNYVSNLSTLTENYMGVSGEKYYEKTLRLLEQYEDYNNNIEVVFIDPTGSEFDAIRQKYSGESLSYGDMIVTTDKNDRYKIVGFADIYEYNSDYVSYGMQAEVTGNNLETALTSAIASCVSDKTAKVAVFTGHSKKDYSQSFMSVFELYNYEIDVFASKLINEIDSEYDAIVIMAPSVDFTKEEMDVISGFLENGGNYSKGLIYFADPLCPRLPNLEELLSHWGIIVNDGILFETYEGNYISGDHTQIYTYPVSLLKEYGAADYSDDDFDDSLLEGIEYFVTGYNAPLEIGKSAYAAQKVSAVAQTLPTTVIAPVGVSQNYGDYSEDDMKQYCTVIESKKGDYDSDNVYNASYIYAFSSLEFIESNWAEMESISNKDIVFACVNRACSIKDVSVNFLSKSISSEGTFAPSATSAKYVKIIFEAILPLGIIAVCIYVYVKRRNR